MDCKPVPETNRLEPRALPRFFVTLDVLRSAVLPDAVAHQVHHGLCLRRGDAICLLDGAGIAWIAQLTEKGRFRIIGRQPVPTEPALQVTLLQALIRTEKLETAIRLCVQAGAAALRIAPSQRSIVRLEKVGEREGDHHGMNRYLPLTRTLKGSRGRVARPAVVSYPLGWQGVAEPKRRDKALRASGIRMPLN